MSEDTERIVGEVRCAATIILALVVVSLFVSGWFQGRTESHMDRIADAVERIAPPDGGGT